MWVWYGRAGVLRAGSSARCEARSAPSVMIDSLPSGATSASFAYQSVSVAVDAATRCSAIGPASVERPVERGRAERQPLRPLEPLVGRARTGVAATVPYWSNAMLKPAAGLVT